MEEFTLKEKIAAIYLIVSMMVGSSVICYTAILAIWHLITVVVNWINEKRSIMEPSSESN